MTEPTAAAPVPVTLEGGRGLSRRSFLAGAGTAALAGLAVPSIFPRYAFATPEDPSSGDVLVVVFLRGGADGLSMVVPYTDTNPGGYYTRRGQGTSNDISIPAPDGSAATGLELQAANGGHEFALHPGLGGADGHGGLMGVWEAGDLAIVHAIGLPESPSRSHFEAQDYWERGSADLDVTSGWVARHLAGVSGSGVPAVGWGPSLQTTLRPSTDAVSMSSIASFGVQGFQSNANAQTALLALHPGGTDDPVRQSGADTLAAVARVQSENPLQYAPAPDPYPTSGFGLSLANGLKEIGMLIRAGLGLKAACIDIGPWDLHDQMGTATTGDMRTAVAGLGDALGAFHTDMGSLMGEVTVVVMSEFGRTIGVNGSGGTDHGRGSCCFVMSANANPGVYGAYPSGPLAPGPEGDLAVTTDIRTVLSEVLADRCGNTDVATVFPTYTQATPLGVVSG